MPKGNKKPTPRPPFKDAPESVWLKEKLITHWENSGLSRSDWCRSLGIELEKFNYSNVLNGKRALLFPVAVRIATACGIDLSELQRELEGK